MENVKLIFDKRKLETLIRLGVPDSALIELLKTGKATPTGDTLVDDYLKTVLTIKTFSSDWGGKRQKKQDDLHLESQDDHHLESQDEKQDEPHLVDNDKYKDNNRIDMDKGVQGEKEKKGVFKKPTVEEVATYCREKGYVWDAGEFVDFYESKAWKIGKNTMSDWKAAARNWERRSGQYGGAKAPATSKKKFDWEDDPNIVYDSETNTGSVEGVWYYHTWDFAKARMAYLKRKEEGGKNNG